LGWTNASKLDEATSKYGVEVYVTATKSGRSEMEQEAEGDPAVHRASSSGFMPRNNN